MIGLEEERAVLGVLLLSSRPFFEVNVEEGLRERDFSVQPLGLIYRAMQALHDADGSFDRLTVSGWLQGEGMLTDAVAVALEHLAHTPVAAGGNLRRYVKRVVELSKRRSLLSFARELQGRIEAGEPTDRLIAAGELAFVDLVHDDRKRGFSPVSEILQRETDRLHALGKLGAEVTGVPSGFADLDAITGGAQAGSLSLIAARPAMGKSALVLNICEYASLRGFPTALFTLEMGEGEIAQRLMASRGPVSQERLRRGDVSDWSKIVAVNAEMAAAPLYVDDTTEMTISELRAKARRLAMRVDLSMVVVDYAQLLDSSAETRSNRVQAVAEIARGLKQLAGELRVPVIALSQLSRQLEQRTDKRPILSDLRESGALEQDADNVFFLYREAVYDKDYRDKTEAELIIAKHRNGALDTVLLRFIGERLRFLDAAPVAAGYDSPPQRYDDWMRA